MFQFLALKDSNNRRKWDKPQTYFKSVHGFLQSQIKTFQTLKLEKKSETDQYNIIQVEWIPNIKSILDFFWSFSIKEIKILIFHPLLTLTSTYNLYCSPLISVRIMVAKLGPHCIM